MVMDSVPSELRRFRIATIKKHSYKFIEKTKNYEWQCSYADTLQDFK